MGRRLIIAAVLVALIAAAGSAVASVAVFPQVTCNFDQSTFTYTYHVVVPQDTTYSFGSFSVYSHAICWDGTQDLWTFKGAIVNGTDQVWNAGSAEGDLGDTIMWRAFGDQEVTAGPWEGDFQIIAENTAPVMGQAETADQVEVSRNIFDIEVPGTLIPEPSSLLALCSMIALAGGLIRRRK